MDALPERMFALTVWGSISQPETKRNGVPFLPMRNSDEYPEAKGEAGGGGKHQFHGITRKNSDLVLLTLGAGSLYAG